MKALNFTFLTPLTRSRSGGRRENSSSVLLRVATTDSSPSTSSSNEEEEASSSFSWRDHWYPVSLIEDLDPSRPTPFQLLNRETVLWKDKLTGDWIAFDDKCPHRLAPLSEGRIDEDGNIQCSYHGWSFDKTGSCVGIPQASNEGPESRAVKSPRACAKKFPTLVSQGLLFVWPDENGWDKASATKPAMLPDDFDSPEFSTVSIQRDLYYGYDTLMENVSDPSHIDFAHHKKWAIWICSFNIPMAPGKTRSIVCSARNFFQLTMPGNAWWQVTPRWFEHWTSNKVYDGDMIVLQGQEKVFLSSSDVNAEYTKITFTPTQADRFVLAFRNWLRRHGNNQPDWFGSTNNLQPPPSTTLSKSQMLDRFEQHTLICSSCRGAYTVFQTLQKVFIDAAIIFCSTSGIPSEMHLRIVLGVLTFLSAGLAYVFHELEKNFVFVDYVNADID
ncbi:hypothetical protein MKX01_027303 [Papaver californicum]|nr:hypothetical protein MKX01_027303 [Papaver californicum]